MSKSYTLNYYLNAVNQAVPKALSKSVAWTLCPTFGPYSVKFTKLNTFLGGHVFDLVLGYNGFESAGKSGKKRLLRALRARKKGAEAYQDFVSKYTKH